MTRPQFFSFEPPVFMEPHAALSLHTCTIVALCLLQQCVVTPPRLDGKVLPSLVFLPELMFQSFYAKIEIWPEKQSEASALSRPVVLPVVLIRDPSQFLFFSSCLRTSTSVHLFLTLPSFQYLCLDGGHVGGFLCDQIKKCLGLFPLAAPSGTGSFCF